jgi:hypothetical protein
LALLNREKDRLEAILRRKDYLFLEANVLYNNEEQALGQGKNDNEDLAILELQ